jgi:hypothetical protein
VSAVAWLFLAGLCLMAVPAVEGMRVVWGCSDSDLAQRRLDGWWADLSRSGRLLMGFCAYGGFCLTVAAAGALALFAVVPR